MMMSANHSSIGRTPHTPVLVEKVMELLALKDGGLYVDGTVGFGGHAEAILKKNKSIQVLGIDRDRNAVDHTLKRLGEYSDRCQICHGNFADIETLAQAVGWYQVNGILLDLGVSSYQIDTADRGFSFQGDGPLDMRMDRRNRVTAAKLLNSANADELRHIFRSYGEEPRARKIAEAVVERAQNRPWERTLELADYINSLIPVSRKKYSKTVARCFQALRIAVNDELDDLSLGIDTAIDMLAPGGRLVVISFHSLEDRIVKKKFVYEATSCICPPGLPECRCEKQPRLKIYTRRPMVADQTERTVNTRAKSAKLRAAEKL